MKKLPIGIQTFSEIINENYCYVDKTKIIHELINSGKYFFLSRPRRFGKSLLIDTIKDLFEGREELFKGLWIEDKWDFSKKHPVIKIDFGNQKAMSGKELSSFILNQLRFIASNHNLSIEMTTYYEAFEELIRKLATKNRTVILIDEYDKPILDNIENPELAKEMREILKGFYTILKGTDAYIKFAMLTGVSKFSKVSLFSGLNNLWDITIDEKYSSICGYTQNDLEIVFKEYLEGVDLEKVKLWYNGYSWLGESVYNPFDILLFFGNAGKEFRNYWFETGSPTFLLKLLKERRYYMPELEEIRAGEELIGAFDVDFIEPAALLFQTGYLTIKGKKQIGAKIEYRLTYPNLEVKSSLNNYLLFYLNKDAQTKENTQSRVYEAIEDLSFELLKDTFFRLFAAIPYEWYIKNELDKYEGYYASIFYAVFASLGYDLEVEESTNRCRIDMAIKTDNTVIIFEFKVVEEEGEKNTALEQIKNRKYYEKYLNSDKEIYLIGIEFSKAERNITRFDWEKVTTVSSVISNIPTPVISTGCYGIGICP
ncbi:MAG: ATP-binding protein [Candidatus Desantisbacteria bacterium]